MNDYYGELCTKMYDRDKSFAGDAELDFYLSFVKDKSMKVLEPMCGNGRMLLPFMQKGVNIDGFDISKDMLKMCHEKAKKLNLRPNVFQENIQDFKSDKKYDLIFIPFGSFSLLPDAIVNDSLYNLKSVLKVDGKLLLTMIRNYGPVEEISDWTETNRKAFNDEVIIEYKMVSYDEKNHIENTTLKYQSIQNGQVTKTEIMDFPIRHYDIEDFEETLQVNGFQHITLHQVKDGYGKGTSFNVYECGL